MRRTAGLLALLLIVAGCRTSSPHGLVVFAAASLKTAFTELGADFSGGGVDLSFAGSADLLTQLTQGAEADVFATADIVTMDKARRAGLLAGAPVSFATNTLTIIAAPGNPKGIKSFRDLADVSLVVCAAQVPCGSALAGLQSRNGVSLHPVSEETSVTDVLNKVTSGQADAGLVYATDARGAGSSVTEVPLADAPANTYQIAVLNTARDHPRADRFVALVTGPTGRKVLAAAGFGAP